MDRTESLAVSYGGRSQFEREKERLIIDINQGMDTVNRNLIQLNQNLESAISLSANFGRISGLWSEFGTIINLPADENGDRNQSSDCEDKSDAQSIEDDASECTDSHAAAADPESGIIGELNTAMEEDL
ncbi:hypothetical protein IWW48_004719 [Coemansia sp. RSA 1200]|nr:hypothetical protein IWW48_004719 [Coemansia sp. RSA 1200]